ncbi:hypothetical protein CHLRE_12g533150v5 [Chlamydomonas reinhardtii]|uniref:CHRD domain-containing protein n=1 Tax=Chlamydomonas reinhardtii TaxID=3055 RepID=A8IVS3_CHLRE|nr:uncharacterized protein CHLRE_12g533150v5 [Chlamydomonas reinhardtii]PNW75597.1 hypothetical protein CHLRE_12g533150v5 [Chlamydomonas reinhardtii]|eukprot:XP_001693011.1 predicted protein [Chlamydomonas reinhardtii]
MASRRVAFAVALVALCLLATAVHAKPNKGKGKKSPKWPDAPAGAIVAAADLMAAVNKTTDGKGYAYLVLPKGGPYKSYIMLGGSMKAVSMGHVHWMNATAKNPIRLGLFPSVTAAGTAVLLNPTLTYKGSATFERTWNETDIGYWGTDITTFLTLLKAEMLYVNVHTAANPGGEIQGTLKCKSPCMWS